MGCWGQICKAAVATVRSSTIADVASLCCFRVMISLVICSDHRRSLTEGSQLPLTQSGEDGGRSSQA